MGIGGEIMRLGIFGIGLAAALAVGGCATGAESGPDRYYACSDGSRIGVSFLSQDAVRVRLPSRKNLILPLVSEDAGNRYADERHELVDRGDQLTWKAGKEKRKSVGWGKRGTEGGDA